MQIHNPNAHNVYCPGLGEDLAAFETRDLEGDEAQRARACPECRCRVTDDEPASSSAQKAAAAAEADPEAKADEPAAKA